MRYRIVNTPEFEQDVLKLAKSEPKAFQKVRRFLVELEQHPKTGTGHPEPLKGGFIN